jgi:tRNA(Ile)-lysidine synthase
VLAPVAATVPDWANRSLALLAPYPRLLLAVSGGPDSVALMLLVARHLANGSRQIDVATVDHGLRPGSAQEAQQVAAWAQELGLPHHILPWRGPKPETRIQERARAARYHLLAACASGLGNAPIVTAHHADDQAETILFRLSRGSGVTGLAGMSLRAERGDAILLRPFLDTPKSTLEAFCRTADYAFLRDPSNGDRKYARARLRALAPLLAERGLDRDALLRLGARAARAEEALASCAAALRQEAIRHVDRVSACFDPAPLAAAPSELLQRVIAGEILRLAPDAPLRLERLERLVTALLAPLAAGDAWRTTLAGVIVECRADALIIRPAPPRRRVARAKGDPVPPDP